LLVYFDWELMPRCILTSNVKQDKREQERKMRKMRAKGQKEKYEEEE